MTHDPLPSEPTRDATSPPGGPVFLPDQGKAVALAQGVMAAYNAYSSGNAPTLPDYTVVREIHVWELDKSVLLGFSAAANDGSHNVVVLRGTQSDEEGLYDLSWGTNTPCILPYGGNLAYGNANESLYDFYTGNDEGLVTSLADSFKQAVGALDSRLPWYVAGHSLGGGMATLGALDAYVSGSYGDGVIKPFLYTFGSLHVGDQSFVNAYRQQLLGVSFRFANLCDFVPSLTGLEEDTTKDPYEHVGLPCVFVWQTWEDWGNHSMENIYLEIVQSHWPLIRYGNLPYPLPVGD